MKIRLVGAELFHVDKQTHVWIDRESRMKLIAAFRNLANSPNKIPKFCTVWKNYNMEVKVHTIKAYGEMNTQLHFS
jgi:hypothetical protein